MYNTATVIDTYITMWNEPDADERRALVSAALTADATYIDPLMSGQGTEAISAMIGAAHKAYPEHRFALVGEPDGHHDYVRFTWSLAPDGEEPVAIGTDLAVLGDDGRLTSVVGFLEAAD
jgi:SnoaL-like domain